MGFGKATILICLGLILSVILLIAPPLPAASLPSNSTITRSLFLMAQVWSFITSICNLINLRSYSIYLRVLSTLIKSLDKSDIKPFFEFNFFNSEIDNSLFIINLFEKQIYNNASQRLDLELMLFLNLFFHHNQTEIKHISWPLT